MVNEVEKLVTIEVTDSDIRALQQGIEIAFDEGQLDNWPRLSVLRAIRIDEKHYLWSWIARGHPELSTAE